MDVVVVDDRVDAVSDRGEVLVDRGTDRFELGRARDRQSLEVEEEQVLGFVIVALAATATRGG